MHYIENDEKSSWKWWNDEKSFSAVFTTVWRCQKCQSNYWGFLQHEVAFFFCTDVKVFTAAAPRTRKTIECTLLSWPKSATSAPAAFCVCTRPTFSHFVIMSVTVFKLGCTHLFFCVCKTWDKIDGAYYRAYCRDELLMKELSPATRSIADEVTSLSGIMHRLVMHVK